MSSAAQVPFDVAFGIEIDYKPGTPDPARIYRAMTSLIEACQAIDIKLAQTVGPQLKPVLFLEDIRTGSLTTFLRSVLEGIDDDAIKNLEWKKLVGSYLVKGKRIMVNYLKDRETIQGSDEIYDLQRVIADAARETGAFGVVPKVLPAKEVAESILLLSNGTLPLGPDDRAKYLSPDGTAEINSSFRVTQERIEEVLTQKTLVNRRDLILKVKKPDFLGDSMWDFRHDNKRLPAKVIDSGWLSRFHKGEVTLHPGDSLEVEAEETVKYGYDQEVLATHYRVLEIRGVIPRSDQ
jgi:hypothetical protein